MVHGLIGSWAQGVAIHSICNILAEYVHWSVPPWVHGSTGPCGRESNGSMGPSVEGFTDSFAQQSPAQHSTVRKLLFLATLQHASAALPPLTCSSFPPEVRPPLPFRPGANFWASTKTFHRIQTKSKGRPRENVTSFGKFVPPPPPPFSSGEGGTNYRRKGVTM